MPADKAFGASIIVVMTLLINVSISWATIWDVPVDFDNIQAAIDAPVVIDGDIIELSVEEYTGEGNYEIDYGNKEITIRSLAGDPESCVIDCNGNGGGFIFNSGEGVGSILEGVTVRNGSADQGGAVLCDLSSPTINNCIFETCEANFIGGGIYCTHSSPVLTNCQIRGNISGISGGGVYMMNDSSPEFTDCTIRNNSAMDEAVDNYGGGIWFYFSSPTFADCRIDSNATDDYGGGIACDFTSGSFDNCVINGNSAGSGGGIFCQGEAHPDFFECLVTGNTAIEGGGIYCRWDGRPSFTDCSIDSNTATDVGGGVAIHNSWPFFTNSDIETNIAELDGGGVFSSGSWPEFENCLIAGNAALARNGGGVLCFGNPSPVFTLNCRISGNSASLRGGGVFCDASSPVFSDCLVDQNSAALGGGVSCDGAAPSFTDCRIEENTVIWDGGGLECRNSSAPDFVGCNMDRNHAGYYGGGLNCNGSSPVLRKCTVNENSAGGSGGGMGFYSGSSPSVTNSIISGNTSGSNGGGIVCSFASGSFNFCTLSDNVADGPDSKGGGVGLFNWATPTFNSVIIAYSDGEGVYFSNSENSGIACSDVYGNTGGNFVFKDGDPAHGPEEIGVISGTNRNGDDCDQYSNININPRFRDQAAGLFHLTDFSRCIGAGDPSDPPLDDFEGNPRPGAPVQPDIGAFENLLETPLPFHVIQMYVGP